MELGRCLLSWIAGSLSLVEIGGLEISFGTWTSKQDVDDDEWEASGANYLAEE